MIPSSYFFKNAQCRAWEEPEFKQGIDEQGSSGTGSRTGAGSLLESVVKRLGINAGNRRKAKLVLGNAPAQAGS